MIDTDSILHPDIYDDGSSSLVKNMLESWDAVKKHYDFLTQYVERVANKIIRKQNEIHSRLEFKRPWANTTYRVTSIDNLGDNIRVHLMDDREVITGEKRPNDVLNIKRQLLTEIHDPAVFEEFFRGYETNLADSIAIKKKNAEDIAKQLLRADFEKAKEFYLRYKDHFEELEKESEAKILPFEEWEAEFYKRDLDPNAKKDFEAMHGLNLDEEVAKIKKEEYALYVQRMKLGIE